MAIYFIQNEVTKNVKIGHSDQVEARLRQLQQGNDCPLKLIAVLDGGKELEQRYHSTWDAYRITDYGDHGSDEWFSVNVIKTEAGVKITGRKKQRTEKKNKVPFRHQLCLRLTTSQLDLLNAYTEFKGFKSGVDSIRFMIDGLEGWLAKQIVARNNSLENSGIHPVTDVATTDVATSIATDVATDVAADKDIDVVDDVGPSVGDFGGRPNPGLPGSLEDHDD